MDSEVLLITDTKRKGTSPKLNKALCNVKYQVNVLFYRKFPKNFEFLGSNSVLKI